MQVCLQQAQIAQGGARVANTPANAASLAKRGAEAGGAQIYSRAWQEALHDGIEPEMLANAALFAALADLIGAYGEDAVAKMANGLSRRIHHGEFTLKRTSQ